MAPPVNAKRTPSPLLREGSPPAQEASVAKEIALSKLPDLSGTRESGDLEEVNTLAKRAHRETEEVGLKQVVNIPLVMGIILHHLSEKDTAALMATCHACYDGVHSRLPVNPFDPQGRKLFFKTLCLHPFTSDILEYLDPSRFEYIQQLHSQVDEGKLSLGDLRALAIQQSIAMLREVHEVTSQVFQGTLSPDDAMARLFKQGPEGEERLKERMAGITFLGEEIIILENGQPSGVLDLIFILVTSQKWMNMMKEDDLFLKDKFESVFAWAAGFGRKDMMKIFLETPEIRAKMSPNAFTEAFVNTLLNTQVETREYLLEILKKEGIELGSEELKEAFARAASLGRKDMMKILLEMPETREKILSHGFEEAFVCAAGRGFSLNTHRIEGMRFLLETPDTRDKIANGVNQAFMDALDAENVDTMRFLLETPEARNKISSDMLHDARFAAAGKPWEGLLEGVL